MQKQPTNAKQIKKKQKQKKQKQKKQKQKKQKQKETNPNNPRNGIPFSNENDCEYFCPINFILLCFFFEISKTMNFFDWFVFVLFISHEKLESI